MRKIISLLLALVLVISLIPVVAAASPAVTIYNPFIEINENSTTNNTITFISSTYDSSAGGGVPGVPEPTESKKEADPKKESDKKKEPPVYFHPTGQHEFGYASNSKYHWLQCACGCQIGMELHVDPLEATDDYCTCGYHFSDNAQLVTLWLKDCKELKDFSKDVYEYETDAYTYKDVKELKRIATRTYDSEATVELPEDLTLQEGTNKIEIKVTSENKKVSQVYTVIVNKEAK